MVKGAYTIIIAGMLLSHPVPLYAENKEAARSDSSTQSFIGELSQELDSLRKTEVSKERTKDKSAFSDFGKSKTSTDSRTSNSWNPLSKERRSFSEYLNEAFDRRAQKKEVSKTTQTRSTSRQNKKAYESFGLREAEVKTLSGMLMKMMEEIKVHAVKTRESMRRRRQR